MTIEILFFGAGAIGAFYGSRLAAITKKPPIINVSVICRSNYSAVKSHGFKVTSPKFGDYTWHPTRVFANPETARTSGVKWDYIVVSTKALPNISDDSALLAGLVQRETAVVLIQNGLGVEEPYARRFPESSVLSAVTIASCAQPENGVIKHNRWTRINVGPYFSERTTPAAKQRAIDQNTQFVDLLLAGGIDDAKADSHEKLQLVRWHKIAINAAMNPSSVLSGLTGNQEMSLDDELYRHLEAVMNEVLTTAPKVVGTPFPDDFATPEQLLKSTQKNSSGSKPSMALDWEGDKAMEVEVILGNPLRLAREKGLEMPRLQTLYALIKMKEKNRDEERAKAKAGGSKL